MNKKNTYKYCETKEGITYKYIFNNDYKIIPIETSYIKPNESNGFSLKGSMGAGDGDNHSQSKNKKNYNDYLTNNKTVSSLQEFGVNIFGAIF